MAGVCLHRAVAGQGEATTACVCERINPNTAPVGSLIRLPGIGATRARAIVAHRDAVREETGSEIAFHASDDLQQIKGIGPKTVADIACWLECDGLGPDGFAASGGGAPHPFASGPTDSPMQDVPNARRD